jgi:hypothetical protein
LVRSPYAKHQFSFLLLTNWAKMPPYESIGFYEAKDGIGETIFKNLNEITMKRSGDENTKH